MIYTRPLLSCDPAPPPDAVFLQGRSGLWFTHCELLGRDSPPRIVPVREIDPETRNRLSTPLAPSMRLPDLPRPALMGVLNVTPDSFSDGGAYDVPERAVAQAQALRDAGAAILDIGGESTRPGAKLVPADEERARVVPVIEALRGELALPISVDTRKAAVAQAALEAGATLLNDVSALRFDPDMASVAAQAEVPICLMHAQGAPGDMQDDPQYDAVLLDIFDHLAARIRVAEDAGIARRNIIVDPGIGFGKTQAHNLAILRRIALFHTLGCPILLGVSRKGFIGQIAREDTPARRDPGSVALALHALSQGVQIIRAHDIASHRQAFDLAAAVTG